jgi:AcrR family transcriptional regulator
MLELLTYVRIANMASLISLTPHDFALQGNVTRTGCTPPSRRIRSEDVLPPWRIAAGADRRRTPFDQRARGQQFQPVGCLPPCDRHFSDKTEIINEVVAQGFVDMTARFRTEAGAFAVGTRDRIVAVGQVYLTFAIAEPALFRMMFSQKPTLSDDDIVTAQGKACFAYVLQEVMDYCAYHRVEGDAQMIALQLWTLVHGAASLTIDGDYAKVAPQIDTREMIASGAERLLFLLPQGHGQ